ncbi:MAG TPA: SDR family NAD(P)-dependent oxidoreductase, partial [Candidatus Hydrogenedentes bacterium]|nr:SDR family NAD(P)-dependent oxidoreductase [Candidatus Hydrogenedentota bacterium]
MSFLETFSLTGKVALITGGAGLYGRQLVRALAEAGAETYTASRNLDALKSLADALAGEGLNIHPVRFDQGEEASAIALRDHILEQAGVSFVATVEPGKL